MEVVALVLAAAPELARRGHPVLLGRPLVRRRGDRGARDYLRTHADRLTVVAVGDVADDTDIDTPDALAGYA